MDRVWYVAYGSNLGEDRFRCYLVGGRPDGGTRTYAGCRDPSDPAGTFSLELPGALVFAGESGVWGGGMAFFDPEGAGSVACRAYLVTPSSSRTWRPRRCGSSRAGSSPRPWRRCCPTLGELHRMGPGRYETVVRVDTRDGIPLLTVTNHDIQGLALAAPSAAYLRSIATGLREAHGWDDARIASYLAAAPGARGSWTTAAVLEALGLED